MEKDTDIYPPSIMSLAKNAKYSGRMNAPDSAAIIKGPCGDEIEFYLCIKDGLIEDIKFYTEQGCTATIICAETTARLAHKKTIDEALGISPQLVKNILKELPADHSHCTILAVSTLYRAIADYLLKD
ncbi:MAG: iron-sulfur cluster assembly scaffold protein [PVC group bacterium]|nr:iron-sulfur cluster assembly scaffold protein [PVC group bacterium]